MVYTGIFSVSWPEVAPLHLYCLLSEQTNLLAVTIKNKDYISDAILVIFEGNKSGIFSWESIMFRRGNSSFRTLKRMTRRNLDK